MALYKTITDQNVNTTWHNPIHHWDLAWGLLNLIENCTKLGVSVQNNRAVNLLNTSTCNIHHMVKFMQMLFLKLTSTNYTENIATDCFTPSTFWVVDYAKPA